MREEMLMFYIYILAKVWDNSFIVNFIKITIQQK